MANPHHNFPPANPRYLPMSGQNGMQPQQFDMMNQNMFQRENDPNMNMMNQRQMQGPNPQGYYQENRFPSDQFRPPMGQEPFDANPIPLGLRVDHMNYPQMDSNQPPMNPMMNSNVPI